MALKKIATSAAMPIGLLSVHLALSSVAAAQGAHSASSVSDRQTPYIQASVSEVSPTQPSKSASQSVTKSAATSSSKQRPASVDRQSVTNRKNQQVGSSTQKSLVSYKSKTGATNRKSFASSERGYDSLGTRLGLKSELSEIVLKSSAVLVVDQASGEVLLQKNPDATLPIASITKIMTSIVTMEANLPLAEVITIEKEDTQLEKYTSSRLRVGAEFTRAELLHLALMSSENRAAHALGRTYPGGLGAFVSAMNQKAEELGMTNSRFVEPTGLSSNNVSTPRDLSRLVNAAYQFPLIRQFSTTKDAIVRVGGRQQQFRNTNALIRNDHWDVGLSKTGFIRDAGKCLVMQANIDNQDVIIVMLDAPGSASRISDAERIRRWLSAEKDRQASLSAIRS